MATVRALIVDNDEILLVLRAKTAEGRGNPLTWCLPGGGLSGQTPEAALHREVLEETQIKVITEAYLGFDRGKDHKGKSVREAAHYFQCRLAPGYTRDHVDTSKDKETARHTWVTPKDILILMNITGVLSAVTKAGLQPPPLPPNFDLPELIDVDAPAEKTAEATES